MREENRKGKPPRKLGRPRKAKQRYCAVSTFNDSFTQSGSSSAALTSKLFARLTDYSLRPLGDPVAYWLDGDPMSSDLSDGKVRSNGL